MAYLEVISGDLKGSTIPLSSLGIHIGRDSNNGVCAPKDPSLGRRHASILPKGSGWVCVDHGSVAGTFVDDDRVGALAAPLLEGSTIRCGRQAFRIWGMIQTRPQGMSLLDLEILQLRQAAKRTDPDLPATVQKAEPARGYAIPPPPDVEARTPGSLSETGRGGRPVIWWGADEPVDVGRKRIPAPMLYLGPADAAPWVVDEFLPVAQFSAVTKGIVWPAAYATFSAAERAGYLAWHANRRHGAAPEAFLLLFLNGLDQRLGEILAPSEPEHGAKCAEERVRIATEIERLLTRNSVAPRFQSYARSLLSELWVEKPANLRFGSLPEAVISGDDPAFLWGAACLAQSFAKFTVEHAALPDPLHRASSQRVRRTRFGTDAFERDDRGSPRAGAFRHPTVRSAPAQPSRRRGSPRPPSTAAGDRRARPEGVGTHGETTRTPPLRRGPRPGPTPSPPRVVLGSLSCGSPQIGTESQPGFHHHLEAVSEEPLARRPPAEPGPRRFRPGVPLCRLPGGAADQPRARVRADGAGVLC